MSLNKNKISELKKVFLEYYRELPVIRLGAGKVGRDEDTIIRWRKDDSDFAEQMAIAKSDWALQKVKAVKSTEWLLERVLRDHFTPPKQEIQEVSKINCLHIYKPCKNPE